MVTYTRRMGGAASFDHTDDMDAVFRALADPTRRLLLDALFATDGQNAAQLCARVPQMTRFGVMKHLALLEDAGLVTTRRAGRSKLHYLNPVPIGLVADRWISKYADPFTRAMVGVRAGLETNDTEQRTGT
jgi:DNA-binding transcriptional ArsR family regulator